MYVQHRRCTIKTITITKNEFYEKEFFINSCAAVIISLSACKSSSSSFEGDVRKMADYLCQIQKLGAKDPADENAKKEIEAIQKEMTEYSNKMETKYKDKKGDKAMEDKAEAIMKEVMAKCK